MPRGSRPRESKRAGPRVGARAQRNTCYVGPMLRRRLLALLFSACAVTSCIGVLGDFESGLLTFDAGGIDGTIADGIASGDVTIDVTLDTRVDAPSDGSP